MNGFWEHLNNLMSQPDDEKAPVVPVVEVEVEPADEPKPKQVGGYQIRRKTGMCRNGAERDGGVLFHAVAEDEHTFGKALCGTKPGSRGNGWQVVEEGEPYVVTCKRCLARLEKEQG